MHVRTVVPVSERRACRGLAQHAAVPGPGGRGCTGLDRPAHHAGAALRALRFPSHHGPAAGRGLAREPQAGGAPLAPGGPPGAPQAPAPAAPLGDRRLLHAAPRRAAAPRLVLRLRQRTDARRSATAVAHHRGRAHAGVPPHRCRAPPAVRRRPGAPHGALRAARPAQLPALGQRPRVHGDSGAVLAPPAGRHDTLHRTRPSLGERCRGILPRHAPRRAPQARGSSRPSPKPRSSSSAGGASTTRCARTAPSGTGRPPRKRWRSDRPTPRPGQSGGFSC